jgi:hypothetical protein
MTPPSQSSQASCKAWGAGSSPCTFEQAKRSPASRRQTIHSGNPGARAVPVRAVGAQGAVPGDRLERVEFDQRGGQCAEQDEPRGLRGLSTILAGAQVPSERLELRQDRGMALIGGGLAAIDGRRRTVHAGDRELSSGLTASPRR